MSKSTIYLFNDFGKKTILSLFCTLNNDIEKILKISKYQNNKYKSSFILTLEEFTWFLDNYSRDSALFKNNNTEIYFEKNRFNNKVIYMYKKYGKRRHINVFSKEEINVLFNEEKFINEKFKEFYKIAKLNSYKSNKNNKIEYKLLDEIKEMSDSEEMDLNTDPICIPLI